MLNFIPVGQLFSPYDVMLNFLCFLALCIAVKTNLKFTLHYMGIFLLFNLPRKKKIKSGGFDNSFTTKKLCDGLPVFRKKNVSSL